MSGPVAARFGIGYAPDDWQPLAGAFPDYQSKVLETAGLVIAGDAGKRYDRFRDRIMFPIHDSSGRVIGFGGRVLDKGEPKYLNSPETPVFSKGRELYGLFQARPAIRAAGKVVVVEGYMDVVALAQHGVEFAVATLGTATTPTHAQKLFRVTETVIFCFDGDEAGRRAAWRALENTLSVLADGKDARFLFLPDGEDPDDFIRKRGKDAFEGLLDQATPLSDFLVNELTVRHPPRSAEGRAALVNAAKPLSGAGVRAGVRRPASAEACGACRAARARNGRVAAVSKSRRSPRLRYVEGASRRAPSLIRGLVQCVLLEPELARRIAVPKPLGTEPESAALAALVTYCEASTAPLTTAGVMQHFAGGMHEEILVAALTAAESEGLTGELLETELVEGVKRYWLNAQRRGDDAESRRAPPVDLSAEETERARQRQLARDRIAGGT